MRKDSIAGRRIGRLTVMDTAGKPNAWRCQCDCGRVEVLTYRQLQRRDSCEVCARGPCATCGGPITGPGKLSRKTCSEPCQVAYQRMYWRKQDARREADPAIRERRRAKSRVYHHAHKDRLSEQRKARIEALSEEELAAFLARQRDRNRNNMRQYRAAMTPDQREEYRQHCAELRRRRNLRRMMAKAQTLMEKVNDR